LKELALEVPTWLAFPAPFLLPLVDFDFSDLAFFAGAAFSGFLKAFGSGATVYHTMIIHSSCARLSLPCWENPSMLFTV
jgi:hypothetical protein